MTTPLPGAGASRLPGLIVSTHEAGAIVFDVARGALFDLNPLGVHVWRHLHDRPLEDIARDLAASYGLDPSAVHDDVRAFVAQLQCAGLLDRRVES